MDPQLQDSIASWTPDPTTAPQDQDWFPPIFDEAPFGIAAVDMVGNFVRVNAAFCMLHGRERDDVVGMSIIDFILSDDAPLYAATLERAAIGEMDEYRAEHEIRRPDGQSFWAIVDAKLLRDRDGHPIYALVQYHDTTDLHLIAEEARAATEAFQLTVDNAPIAIYSVDLTGTVVDWNPAAERLFGWSADEVIGHEIPVVPSDGMDAAVEGLALLVAGETIPAQEAVLQHRDGRRLQVVTTATVTHKPDGSPDRIVALTMDMTRTRDAEAELERSEARLRTIFAKTTDTVMVVDTEGQMIYSMAEYYDTLGYPTDFWADRDIFSLLHPDDVTRASEQWQRLLDEPRTELIDVFRIQDAGGGWEHIEITGINLADDPEIGGILLTARFVTELRRARDLLSDEAATLHLIARNADLRETLYAIAEMVERNTRDGISGIIVLDDDGRMQVGAAPRAPQSLLAEVDDWEPYGLFAEALERGETIVIADSETDPLVDPTSAMVRDYGLRSGWITPITDERNGRRLGVLCTYYGVPDATTDTELEVARVAADLCAIAIERSAAHHLLHHQAHHDPLTGLPNRTMILEQLAGMLEQAEDVGGSPAVMFLDLDRFKVVNDSLGHVAGDHLLTLFAERLQGLARPSDLVGRFSADEFVVLVAEHQAGSDVYNLANRLTSALVEPFVVEGGDIHLSVSMGVALAGTGADANQLVEQASAALLEAKKRGRDRLETFDHRFRTRARDRLQLERDLRRALDQGELKVHYQPKVALDTGAICGAEALLRWEHPDKGLILPDQFIPVAEETGLIVNIGRWVLEEAVREVSTWTDLLPDPEDFCLAVNFSARQLTALDLINNLARVLLKYRWRPDQLSVELTESILIGDAPSALAVLAQLKELGVKLSIDDFGTGYSSLSYLHQFPVDIVKIDQAFVRDLEKDGSGSPVVSAVMHMSEALGLITAAEGVEQEVQLLGLRELGCRWAQGFYFAHPLPAAEMVALLGASPRW